MGKYFTQFSIVSLTLLFMGACQKEEFTQPVATQLLVKLADGSSPTISFETGTVFFQQIQFDGHRQQGGDVHFSTKADKPMGPVTFSNESEGFIKHFDIPQGVYSHMQWLFVVGDMDELDDATDGDDEGDELDIDGGILISGHCLKADGRILPLRIVIDEDEQFRVNTFATDDAQTITLTAANSYAMLLLIDPYYAVRSISSASWENAEVENDDDELYIEVSSDANEDLYETILFRLESSMKVIIQ
ncbi:hypothetical protein KDU71_14325 [Carboxylicivirga sediminis]|uniref:Uncharacterized protein n=1 Tax=Carboxylicivirga sediminis TaxID=2006564 RepID=A0A941F6V6_9BACT|nr:hypothetical protein [Carboxylicivirga sediminis]MBR8536749.1 hypothetical protein [Carboxylicivirga sediminis]